MTELGQHVIAALGWDRDLGWSGTREAIDRALSVGVGGFLLRGGPRGEVAQLARALHAHAPHAAPRRPARVTRVRRPVAAPRRPRTAPPPRARHPRPPAARAARAHAGRARCWW